MGGESSRGDSGDRSWKGGRGLPRSTDGRGAAEHRAHRSGYGSSSRPGLDDHAPPPNAPRGPRASLSRGGAPGGAPGPPANAPRFPRLGLAQATGGLPPSSEGTPSAQARRDRVNEGLPSIRVNQDTHSAGGLPPYAGYAHHNNDTPSGPRVDGRLEMVGDDTDGEEVPDDEGDWWCGVQDMVRNRDKTQPPKGPAKQLEKVKRKMLLRHQRIKGVPFTRRSRENEEPLKDESQHASAKPVDWDSHPGGRTRWYQYAPRALVKMSKGGKEEKGMVAKMEEDIVHLVDYANYREIYLWDVYGVSLECEGPDSNGEWLLNDQAQLKWYDTTGAYLSGYESTTAERNPTRAVWFARDKPTKAQLRRRRFQDEQRRREHPEASRYGYQPQLTGMVRKDRSPEPELDERTSKKQKITGVESEVPTTDMVSLQIAFNSEELR